MALGIACFGYITPVRFDECGWPLPGHLFKLVGKMPNAAVR